MGELKQTSEAEGLAKSPKDAGDGAVKPLDGPMNRPGTVEADAAGLSGAPEPATELPGHVPVAEHGKV